MEQEDWFAWPSTSVDTIREDETVFVWPNGECLQSVDLETATADYQMFQAS